jgi:hypothetical protein
MKRANVASLSLVSETVGLENFVRQLHEWVLTCNSEVFHSALLIRIP